MIESIHVKSRLRAGGIHLSISIIAAVLAALLVFGLWYPYPYWDISGGRNLFVLLVMVDVIMGPLVTAVIFNRMKSRRELFLDLSVVGLLQLAALGYGMWTAFAARPVHLVFEYSRMTVVHAIDVEPEWLAKAPPAFQYLPVTGPTLIALRPFKNSDEQLEFTMAALNGAPLAIRGELWQAYDASKTEILQASRPVSELGTRFPSQSRLIDRIIAETKYSADTLRYLPMISRQQAWTVVIDVETAQPRGYLPLDSL